MSSTKMDAVVQKLSDDLAAAGLKKTSPPAESLQYQPFSVTRVDLSSREESLEVNLAQVACALEIPAAAECWILYASAVKAPERVHIEDDGTGEVDPLVGEPVGPTVLHAIKVSGSYDAVKPALQRALPPGSEWREVVRAKGMVIAPRGLVLQAKRVEHERLFVNFHFVAHTNRNYHGCQVVFLNIHLPPRLDVLESQLAKLDTELQKQAFQAGKLQAEVAKVQEHLARVERQRLAEAAARQLEQQRRQREALERRRVQTRLRTLSFPRGDCLPYVVVLPSVAVLREALAKAADAEPEPEAEPCRFGAACRDYPNCDSFHPEVPKAKAARQPGQPTKSGQPPLCKFGDNCARYPDCGFTHERPPLAKTVPLKPDTSKTPCLFGDRCQKWPDCSYFHASPPAGRICSFGDACRKYPNCGFHHERPPQPEAGSTRRAPSDTGIRAPAKERFGRPRALSNAGRPLQTAQNTPWRSGELALLRSMGAPMAVPPRPPTMVPFAAPPGALGGMLGQRLGSLGMKGSGKGFTGFGYGRPGM